MNVWDEKIYKKFVVLMRSVVGQHWSDFEFSQLPSVAVKIIAFVNLIEHFFYHCCHLHNKKQCDRFKQRWSRNLWKPLPPSPCIVSCSRSTQAAPCTICCLHCHDPSHQRIAMILAVANFLVMALYSFYVMKFRGSIARCRNKWPISTLVACCSVVCICYWFCWTSIANSLAKV